MKIATRINDALKAVFGDNAPQIKRGDVEKVRTLLEDGETAYDIASPFAGDIARKIGLDPKTSITKLDLKKLTRIFEKALGKHNGDLTAVKDPVRFRLLIDGPDKVKAIRALLVDNHGFLIDRHPTNEITITEFEDFFYEPSSTGRIGIHINLCVKTSGAKTIPVEIQVIDYRMLETEKITHDNYQRSEEIRRKAASENRPLTDEEKTAAEGYRESNRQRYLADSINYGYYDLRHPRFMTEAPNLELLEFNKAG